MEGPIATVKVSPKYQIVIPKEVRECLGIRPGDELELFPYEGLIELVPVKKARDLRGFFQGIDTTIKRDRDRV